VARFLDIGNVLEGVQRSDGCVETPAGVLQPACAHSHPVGEKRSLLVRPTGAQIQAEVALPTTGPAGCTNRISSVVQDVIFHQDRFKVVLTNHLYFYLTEAPRIGEPINLILPASAYQCLS
jgi:hypothetical protein